MRRREFMKLLGGAAAAWPVSARAQQAPMPVIGFLGVASPETWTKNVAAFKQGLSQTGFVEGQNVVGLGTNLIEEPPTTDEMINLRR